MSDLLNTLLEKRGIHTDHVEAFLNPSYENHFHDPFLMRDMEKVCVRLAQALENNEKILIYADYDCDGIPGAVILHDLFNKLSCKNFDVYIPQRNSEGYGLNFEAIERMKNDGVKVLITIDLGITAVAEIALAQKNGIDVIVTDHHIPHGDLPQAFAILNPKCDDYPEKMLCGAGVAFKLAQGLLKFYEKHSPQISISPGWEKWLLDMAGLATLSDMVPLTGENRAIAYFGMKVLRRSPRPGLQKLLAKLSINQMYLSEDDIGFMVTPRLNAASRMDDPRRAFELLSTTDAGEGGALAVHLSKINDDRKQIVASIMREVNKKFEDREMKEVIVIGNNEWKVGVLGLVAGKICDEHKRPVFVWGKDENDLIKGSCRSDGSVSVVELMTDAKDHFLDFGGHELAGGFTVHNEKIHFLEDMLSQSFHKVKKIVDEKEISFDIKTNLGAITMGNWKEIEKMSPFGLANAKPVFLFENLKIENIKKFGKNGSGEHLEITVSDSFGKAKGVAFFSGLDSFSAPIVEGLPINVLATFDLSRFAGKVELRLRIIDII